MPPAARTVKPLTSVLGGKAGGEKFLAMGILFKCVPRPQCGARCVCADLTMQEVHRVMCARPRARA